MAQPLERTGRIPRRTALLQEERLVLRKNGPFSGEPGSYSLENGPFSGGYGPTSGESGAVPPEVASISGEVAAGPRESGTFSRESETASRESASFPPISRGGRSFPRSRKRPGGVLDLVRYTEATRRALYDRIVAIQFSPVPDAAPGDWPGPTYTPDASGLNVFHAFSRWFATWTDLDEPNLLLPGVVMASPAVSRTPCPVIDVGATLRSRTSAGNPAAATAGLPAAAPLPPTQSNQTG